MKIDLDSAVAETQLYLTRGNSALGDEFMAGSRVLSADGLPTTNAARIERILKAGTYSIEATTAKPGFAGAFTLGVTPAAAQPAVTEGSACAADFGTAAAGTDVSHELTASCSRGNASNTFTLASPAVVSIDMFHDKLDNGWLVNMRLYKQGQGGSSEEIAWLQDAAGALHYSGSLEAGTYRIAPSFHNSAAATGAFSIRLRVSAPRTVCAAIALGELASGDTARSGSWSADCESALRAKGTFARRYSFTLAQRSDVAIGLASSAADPYLYLTTATAENPNAIISRDDDGGAGTNSRIATTLEAGTTYTVEATTDLLAQTGAFALSINAAPVARRTLCDTVDLGAVNGRETRDGAWSDNCESSARSLTTGDAIKSRYYSFTLARRMYVAIDAAGAGADPVLWLSANGAPPETVIETDDDDGFGRAARIRRFMDAGTYVVEVGELGKSPSRSFRARCRRRAH